MCPLTTLIAEGLDILGRFDVTAVSQVASFDPVPESDGARFHVEHRDRSGNGRAMCPTRRMVTLTDAASRGPQPVSPIVSPFRVDTDVSVR
jgi:hypothetical protein